MANAQSSEIFAFRNCLESNISDEKKSTLSLMLDAKAPLKKSKIAKARDVIKFFIEKWPMILDSSKGEVKQGLLHLCSSNWLGLNVSFLQQ